jgi:hypothetical protein
VFTLYISFFSEKFDYLFRQQVFSKSKSLVYLQIKLLKKKFYGIYGLLFLLSTPNFTRGAGVEKIELKRKV